MTKILDPVEQQIVDELNNDLKLTVICGANKEVLEDMKGLSVAKLRRNMTEVLNIGADHTMVLVNGKEVGNIEETRVMLEGNEEVQFVKPSGRKG